MKNSLSKEKEERMQKDDNGIQFSCCHAIDTAWVFSNLNLYVIKGERGGA
jgi:hypothetical protein